MEDKETSARLALCFQKEVVTLNCVASTGNTSHGSRQLNLLAASQSLQLLSPPVLSKPII